MLTVTILTHCLKTITTKKRTIGADMKSFILLLLAATSVSFGAPILRIHGSNTVGADLAPQLATDYLKSLGAVSTEVVNLAIENEMMVIGQFANQATLSIEIKAHGSSTGFKSLQKSETDIAMSSRPIKHVENLNLMLAHGDMTQAENEHVVALDGLAVITHPSNPIKSLTIQQLAAIFSGEINNWSALGGQKAKIRLYARDANSGTFDTFKALVLKTQKKKLSGEAKRFESNSVLASEVEQDPHGIGFTGLAYASQPMLVSVSADQGLPAIKPARFSVASEDYPLARRLFMYANIEKSRNQHVKPFLTLAKNSHSQKTVTDVGFVAQVISSSPRSVDFQAPVPYQQLAQHAQRLSSTFRMHADRPDMDTKSQQDIDRLIAYFNEIQPEKITLVGFSANESDPERNRKRSYIRSKLLAHALRQHGFRNVEILALGAVMPIDTDDSPTGRYKNNRTEIWVSHEPESTDASVVSVAL